MRGVARAIRCRSSRNRMSGYVPLTMRLTDLSRQHTGRDPGQHRRLVLVECVELGAQCCSPSRDTRRDVRHRLSLTDRREV